MLRAIAEVNACDKPVRGAEVDITFNTVV